MLCSLPFKREGWREREERERRREREIEREKEREREREGRGCLVLVFPHDSWVKIDLPQHLLHPRG